MAKVTKNVARQITVVAAVVIRNGCVLMAQRHEPECPGAHLKWELPGGKVELNETIEKAVARECREETGVRVKVRQLLPISSTFYWQYKEGVQQTLVFYYLCDYVSQKAPKPDHHIKQVAWKKLTALKRLKMLPDTDKVIAAVNSKKQLGAGAGQAVE